MQRLPVIIAGIVFGCAGLAVAGERPIVDDHVTARLAGPHDSAAVWVFLSSKDPLGGNPRRDDHSLTWISARALERRVKRGLPSLTEKDRPVAADAIRALQQCGLCVRTTSCWLTAVSGWATSSALEKLSELPWIDSVRLVQVYRRPMELEHEKPELPKSQEGLGTFALDYGPSLAQLAQIGIVNAHSAGYFGEGVFIGILDTGFNPDVEAFDSTRLIATRDFINVDDDVADGDARQMDHGTKVWSVCAASVPGKLIGGAHRADFALAKTEIADPPDLYIEEDLFILGLWWFDSLGVDVVSSSLGYPDFYEYNDLNGRTAKVTQAVNAAASSGMLVVTAAGNRGFYKDNPWVYPPGDSDSALTVGAVFSDGTRVSFSSRGPTADGRIKPDVMAMGSGVQVADDVSGVYGSASGTSFSTPLAACACALLLQKYPMMTPMEVITRMRQTASQAETPDNEMGYGIVDLVSAMFLDWESPAKVLAFPNPFTDAVQFQLPPVESGPIRLRIFTSAGNLVFAHDIFGQRSYVWDGRNESLKKVAGGVYLCWFGATNWEYTVKVACLRRE